jgi:hypothetical protein
MEVINMRQGNTMNKPGKRLAGIAFLAGMMFFFFNYTAINLLLEPLDAMFYPTITSLVKSAFLGIVSLCLVGGALALLTLNGPANKSRNALGFIAVIITLLGVVLYAIGSVYVVASLVEYCARSISHTLRPY